MKTTYIRQIAYMLFAPLLLLSCKGSHNEPEPDTKPAAVLADFSWTGTQQINKEITLLNSSQNADSFKWDFGNGETSNKQTPDKISYTTEGTYNITLTATKGNSKAVAQKTIVIAPNNQPVAHFSFSFKDQKTYAPATVNFTNQSVNAQTYKWTIKGQNYYNIDPPAVTFNQPGDYPISLTAINGTSEVTYTDIVTVTPNTNPIASFALAYHPVPYHINEPIQLVNTSKNSDSWVWTFGNGGPPSTTDQHPEVKFSTPGMYTITLIAKKGSLQSTPKSINLQINP